MSTSSYASAYWTERDQNFKIETRHYGDLEALRTNTIYSLTAIVLTAFCVYVFTKLLDKRTIHAGKNAVVSFSFVILVTVAFNLVRPATKLPLSDLRASKLILNTCVYSDKGGKMPRWSSRDCMFGEGAFCSLKSPCTPCNPIPDIDEHIMFDIVQSIYRGNECRKCTTTNQVCPYNSAEEGKNYCKKKGKSFKTLDEKVINADISQKVAGWEVIRVEQCRTCCATRRTMEFFADRRLSMHDGASNLGKFKNVTISGSLNPQSFRPIYLEILDILENDSTYFTTVGGVPDRTMLNYTKEFEVDLFDHVNLTSYCNANPCPDNVLS